MDKKYKVNLQCIFCGSKDFEYDINKEQEALRKEFEKQKHKFQKKYKDSQLKEKIIDTLLRKGYNYEHIKELINEEGALDDE